MTKQKAFVSAMWFLLLLAIAGILVTPVQLWSQSVTSASIVGKVTDISGAAIPDATITISSPALQVPKMTTTTDAEGNYRFLDLPPGLYMVTVTAQGFQTFLRSDVRLGVGFSGKVDAEMKVGAVAQSVEVTGSSPVVDTISSTGATSLQLEELDVTPRGQGMQELLPLAAGVTYAGAPDVGDSALADRRAIITYGVNLQPTLNIEGINTTTSHDRNTAVYMDSFNMGEVEFKTSGNNAEVAFPGVAMEAVVKSGGNDFHGDYQGHYETPSLQGNNITPALRQQGFNSGNFLNNYYDYAGNFGGRIIRDKLWFFGGASRQSVEQGAVNTFTGPATGCWNLATSGLGKSTADGCTSAVPGAITSALTEYNIKGSYQMTATTKLIGVYQHATKFLSSNGGSSTRPIISAQFEKQPETLWKAEVQSAPTSHLIVNALFGLAQYHVHYTAWPGTDVAGNPSRYEVTTGFYFGGPYEQPTNRPQIRYEGKGSAAYLHKSHQFKFGFDMNREEGDTQVLADKKSGDYLLRFNNGLPNQITIYNYPSIPKNNLHSYAGFVTDTWRLKRVTLNLGVRGETYDSFYPNQKKPAGQYSVAQDIPGRDLLRWVDVVPRVGGAWDLAGNGKTVIKGSFGMFGDTMGDLWGNTYNPNGVVSATYTWNGPCAATQYFACDYVPGTINFAPIGATDSTGFASPVSVSGGKNVLNNPNLKQNKTYEATARLQRELVPNVALSVGYVYHRVANQYNSFVSSTNSTAGGIHYQVPLDAYDIPVTFTDGLTNDPVTIWTFDKPTWGTKYTALQLVNAPSDRPDVFHSFEVVATKRYSKRWNAQTSFWLTKNHQWIQAIVQSPNDLRFPIDDTWNWEARFSGSYNLPAGFTVSSTYRAQSGIPGQRVQNFASNTTTGQVLNQGTVTLRMGPYGQYRGPVIGILDFKAERTFRLGEHLRLQPEFELFNLTNSSASDGISYLTGSTFLTVTDMVSPRIARFGAEFSF